MRTTITAVQSDNTLGLMRFLNADNDVVVALELSEIKTEINGNTITVYDDTRQQIIDADLMDVLGFANVLAVEAFVEQSRTSIDVTAAVSGLEFIVASGATTGIIDDENIVRITAWSKSGGPLITYNGVSLKIPNSPVVIYEAFFNNHDNVFNMCPVPVVYDANGGEINIIIIKGQ